MDVVVYRNIKGKFQSKAYKWWKSFVSLLGFSLEEHHTKNTRTITIHRKEVLAAFTIYNYNLEPVLYLDYLRLEPADPQLVKLIDCLIQNMNLSGEKHSIEESARTCTFFIEGNVQYVDHTEDLSKFDLLLLKETILGFVHLSLDYLVEFQRSDKQDKVTEIKETLSHYQKFLTKLNEQIKQK